MLVVLVAVVSIEWLGFELLRWSHHCCTWLVFAMVHLAWARTRRITNSIISYFVHIILYARYTNNNVYACT